jgi:hypothetical protein
MDVAAVLEATISPNDGVRNNAETQLREAQERDFVSSNPRVKILTLTSLGRIHYDARNGAGQRVCHHERQICCGSRTQEFIHIPGFQSFIRGSAEMASRHRCREQGTDQAVGTQDSGFTRLACGYGRCSVCCCNCCHRTASQPVAGIDATSGG